MPYGIGLTFDERTSARVRLLWRAFEEAGVGKTPGQLGLPPHVTSSLFSSGKPDVLVSLVEALSVADPSLKLVPFGAFLGEKHTLYLHAVLSPDLVQAHARHVALARARGPGTGRDSRALRVLSREAGSRERDRHRSRLTGPYVSGERRFEK